MTQKQKRGIKTSSSSAIKDHEAAIPLWRTNKNKRRALLIKLQGRATMQWPSADLVIGPSQI